MSKHPEVLWAQRSSISTPEKNVIYLTVNLPDIIESTFNYALTPTGLSFKASAGSGEQTNYAFDLEFFGAVDPEKSTNRLTSRSLVAVLRKKELQTDYWPRLTKEKLKTPFIKTDFSKWVDEDEQDGNPSVDDDFGGVGGIPGMSDDMDFSRMMQQAGGGFNPGGDFNPGAAFNPGGAPVANDDTSSDSDDDGPPPLEEVEPK